MENTLRYTLEELAQYVKVELQGDGATEIFGLQTLQAAQAGQLSFLANPLYQKYLADTQATAVIVHPDQANGFLGPKLITDDPYLVYAKLSKLFDRSLQGDSSGIHPSAVIETSAQLAADVVVGANAYIGERSVLKSGVVVGPGSSVGSDCVLGERTRLHANVTFYYDVHVGNDCIFHSGCVMGADGFGFAPSADGWVKIHQIGGVRIGDRVEIGAASTIDRGALDHTVIEDGVIIDDQVMIGHNVRVGANTAMAGTVSIAGSTTIGKNCILGGGVGVVGHLTIADGSHFTARTLVNKSVAEAGQYSSSTPMQPTRDWRKSAVRFTQLDKLVNRLSRLEKQIQKKHDD